MKQPEDTSTAELNIEIKRGRGRPALENALTPAERAKRYRDAKRASGTQSTIKRDASQKQPETIPDYVSEGLAADWEEKAKKLQASLYWERDLVTTMDKELTALRTQLELTEAERNAAFAENGKLQGELFSRDTAQMIFRDTNEEKLDQAYAEIQELKQALGREQNLSHQINDSLEQEKTKNAELLQVKAKYGAACEALMEIDIKKRDAAMKKRDADKKRRAAAAIKKHDASRK